MVIRHSYAEEARVTCTYGMSGVTAPNHAVMSRKNGVGVESSVFRVKFTYPVLHKFISYLQIIGPNMQILPGRVCM